MFGKEVSILTVALVLMLLSGCSSSYSNGGCHYEGGEYNPLTGAYMDRDYVCEDDGTEYEAEDSSEIAEEEEYQQELEEQLQEEQEENERLQEELDEMEAEEGEE